MGGSVRCRVRWFVHAVSRTRGMRSRRVGAARKMDNEPKNDALTPQTAISDALRRELATMRRNPEGYSVVRMVKCALGCGKAKAYSLAHANSASAGTWCLSHGWLFFDSVALPPTERLSAAEIEDNRLAEQRQKDWQRRKAAKE